MKLMISDTQIDFGQMTATRGTEQRRLTRQTAGILLALHAAQGDVVSKEALISQVWDGRIITDATLSTAIKEARRTVGDSGSAQQIIETVHGVGFRLAVTSTPLPDGPKVVARKPVVVVLPFRSLSASQDDTYIAEGLSEEITSNLSRFRNLTVLSHFTAIHFQSSGAEHAELVKRYNVDFVIEGSLRRSPDRLRVTVQVSDVGTGELALLEQFDRARTTEGIFEIQEEVGLLIAGRVGSQHGEFGARLRRKSARGQTATWDLYMAIGQFYEFYRTYSPALHLDLRERLPELLENDPSSSDGWAAYALILLEEQRYHLNERPDVHATQQGLKAAKRAVACDPQSAFAFMAQALCQFHSGDLSGFQRSAKAALGLNSGHADILAEIGHCHAFLGNFETAIPLLDQAIALSPIHPGWYHYAHAWRYALGAFWQAALLEIEKVPMPGFAWYHAHQVWFHAELGNMGEAEAAKQALLNVFPSFERDIPQEMVFHYFTGPLVQKAFEGWKKAGLRIAEPSDAHFSQVRQIET